MRRDVQAQLQQLVTRQAGKKSIHNLVAGIQTGTLDLNAAACSGFADAAQSVAMSLDTPYYLASITKMYTATVAMKLSDAGRLDLDAPISAYLDSDLVAGTHVMNDVDHGAGVTVLQLLNQTSGFPDYFDGKPKGGTSLADDLKQGKDRTLGIADIVDIVRTLRPLFAPGEGERAAYSDTNYAYLGAIIESVTLGSMAANYENFIFAPLGLKDSYVFDADLAQSRPADMYFKDKRLDIPLAMSSFTPDGGLVSTLTESLAFLRGFFGGELVSESQRQFMMTQWRRIFFPLKYGVGLMHYQPPRWMSPFSAAPELVGHSGSTGSFAFYNPERDVYFAGTVNQMDNPGRPYRLASQLMALLD